MNSQLIFATPIGRRTTMGKKEEKYSFLHTSVSPSSVIRVENKSVVLFLCYEASSLYSKTLDV